MRSVWREAPIETLTEEDSAITYGVVKPGGEGNVLFVRGGDIVDGVVREDALRTISAEVSNQYRRTLLRGGELLISLVGQPGQVAVASSRLVGANIARQVGLIRLRPEIDPYFISYFLRSPDGVAGLGKFTGGSVQQVINLGDLRMVSVPVPPPAEQARIVAILDEAFEGIATAKANAEKNLQNAREVFKNRLESVFSAVDGDWAASPVGLVADCCLGKMLDKSKNKGELKPYLRNLNVRWFEFDLSDVQEMRFTPEETERYSVRSGDVVICEGGYPGRAAIWDQEDAIFFQKALHRVRFANPALARWFLYFLYSQETSGKLRQYFTGTGIQHFTGAALSRLILPIPPTHKVDEFVEGFDAVAREVACLEEIYKRKLAALDELKKSLLHQAFSGQL